MNLVNAGLLAGAAVVGPAPGDRWRNDDGGETVCPTCPVVKFVAQKSGFYTVIVTPKTGQPTSSSFRFRYGQYNNGNINCQNPTPKL